MLKLISQFVLWIWGWKVHGYIPPEIKKCVILVAPHTSNLDFVIGRLSYFKLGVNVKFLIKKEAFKFPFGGLLKSWGGIPVDRRMKNDMINHVAELFDKNENLLVTVTPEGTRRLSPRWKKGFYLIATTANIPIILGFLDYKKKCCGFGPPFYPSGDYEKDLPEIEKFYFDKTPRHPENFNLSEINYKKSK